jgi:hypothetical protein
MEDAARLYAMSKIDMTSVSMQPCGVVAWLTGITFCEVVFSRAGVVSFGGAGVVFSGLPVGDTSGYGVDTLGAGVVSSG